MSFEAKLRELYQQIARQVNDMIPVQWETFFLIAEENDDGGSVDFHYTIPEYKDKLFYSNSIPKDHGIDANDYHRVLFDLIDLVVSLRKAFVDDGQAAWYTFVMIVTAGGKMHAEFGYTNWQKSEYHSTELTNYFIYKHIDKKYLPPDKWSKMEEIAQYDKTHNGA
jgi:uncharacterized protein (TIGR01741 family)